MMMGMSVGLLLAYGCLCTSFLSPRSSQGRADPLSLAFLLLRFFGRLFGLGLLLYTASLLPFLDIRATLIGFVVSYTPLLFWAAIRVSRGYPAPF